MKYLEKPMHHCDICGESRRWGDHTECSKQRQAEHKPKAPKNRKLVGKSSEAYFEALLKRIGE